MHHPAVGHGEDGIVTRGYGRRQPRRCDFELRVGKDQSKIFSPFRGHKISARGWVLVIRGKPQIPRLRLAPLGMTVGGTVDMGIEAETLNLSRLPHTSFFCWCGDFRLQ